MQAALESLAKTTGTLLKQMQSKPELGFAAAVPYLRMCGIVAGGWLLARSAAIAAGRLAAGDADREFLERKLVAARFYAENILPQADSLAQIAVAGGDSITEAAVELI